MALLVIGVIAVYGQKGSDGFTDEERPYEFGFNIEGYQHRHEKKGKEQLGVSHQVMTSFLESLINVWVPQSAGCLRDSWRLPRYR